MSVQTASRGSGMALHGIPLVRQVQLDPLELQVHLDPPELLVIPAHLAHLAHLDPPVIPAHLAHLDLPEHQEFLAPLDLREHPGSRVQPELLVLQVPVSIIFRTPHQLLHTQTAIGGMTPQPDWNLFGLLLA